MTISALTTDSPAEETIRPITSLRDWLDHLVARDRLAIARPGVSLRFELAAIAKRLDGRKASVFPSPGGHPVPVISGLVSDRGWMAEAMGVTRSRVLRRFEDAALNPVPWRKVAAAPAQEVVHREFDLGALLPIPTHNEHDSGPYITAGLVIARNPRTGIQNVAIHRLQLTGPDRLGALLLPRHTLSFQRTAEEGAKTWPSPSRLAPIRSPFWRPRPSRRSTRTNSRSPARFTASRSRS